MGTSEPSGTDRLLFRRACDDTIGQRIYGWTGPWPPPPVLFVVTAPLSRETAVTTQEALDRVVSAGRRDWPMERFKLHHASAIDAPAGRDDHWFRAAEYLPDEADPRYVKMSPNERLLTAILFDPTLGDPPAGYVVATSQTGEQPHRCYGPIADEASAQLRAQQLRDDFAADPDLAGVVVTVIPTYAPEPHGG